MSTRNISESKIVNSDLKEMLEAFNRMHDTHIFSKIVELEKC